jgi:chromosomal replication initiation ATPase DnaA
MLRNPDSGNLILETIARRAGVTAGVLFKSRNKEVAAWRKIAIYLLRKSGRKMAEVAAIASRDASTISRLVSEINEVKRRKWFQDLSDSIEEELDKRSICIRANEFCQRIPMEVYAQAFASADD